MQTLIWIVIGAALIVGAYILFSRTSRQSEPAQAKPIEDASHDETPAEAAADQIARPQPASVVSMEAEQKSADSNLDEGLDDSFPASDPPSITSPNTTGSPSPKSGKSSN